MNSGDFYTGMLNSYRVVAESLIDDTVLPEDDAVNIIGEQTLLPYGSNNSESLFTLFQKLNIKVNCRFIGDTTTTQIRQFKKAKVNIPFIHDP
jgi:nitrogenase molybdenum-iron protein alpha/beta subunit